MTTKSEPAFQPEPPVRLLPAPDDALAVASRQIASLRLEVMQLKEEAARTEGTSEELRNQLRRAENDREHYHEVALVQAALIDTTKNAALYAHDNTPPLRPLNRETDEDAAVFAAKFVASAAE